VKTKIKLPAGWVRVRPSRAKIGDRYTYMEPDPRDVPDAWFSRPIDWSRINERHELPMPAGDGIVIARRVSTPHTDAIQFILSDGRKKPAKAKPCGKGMLAVDKFRTCEKPCGHKGKCAAHYDGVMTEDSQPGAKAKRAGELVTARLAYGLPLGNSLDRRKHMAEYYAGFSARQVARFLVIQDSSAVRSALASAGIKTPKA